MFYSSAKFAKRTIFFLGRSGGVVSVCVAKNARRTSNKSFDEWWP